MEFHLKDLAKAAGQIRAIERRVRQLWALAASLMIMLAVVVVSAQLARPEPWPGNGLPEEIRWGAIVIGIPLAAGYLWSRMRELLRANSHLFVRLQSYAGALERQNRGLSALNELSEKLVGARSLDDALEAVLDTAVKATRADGGSILVHHGNDLVTARGSAGSTGTIPAWVARRGEPVMLVRGEDSSIWVPLRLGGEVVGVLGICGCRNRPAFGQADLDLLTAISLRFAKLEALLHAGDSRPMPLAA